MAASSQHQMDVNNLAHIRSLPGNQRCVDCQVPHPQWASVNMGTLLCLDCSGAHRSLGVHLSFVRSLQMDSWNEKQIKSLKVRIDGHMYVCEVYHTQNEGVWHFMQYGGNENLRSFFQEHGMLDEKFQDRYNSLAAEYYRERLKAKVNGEDFPSFDEWKARQVTVSSTANNGDNNETEEERYRREKAEAEERLKAKFGKAGIGATSVGSGGYGSSQANQRKQQDNFVDDFDEMSLKAKQAANEAWGKLYSAVNDGFTKVSHGTREFSQKVKEKQIGDQVSQRFQYAADQQLQIANPETYETAARSAGDFFAKAGNVATSWWSQAATNFSSLLDETTHQGAAINEKNARETDQQREIMEHTKRPGETVSNHTASPQYIETSYKPASIQTSEVSHSTPAYPSDDDIGNSSDDFDDFDDW